MRALGSGRILLRLGWLVAAAWLTSGIIQDLISQGPGPWTGPGAWTPAASAAAPQAAPSNAIIVERNAFGSRLAGPPAPGLPPALPLSPLRAQLVATVVAEPEAWSLALVTDLERAETGAYRLGDSLLGEATLEGIRLDRVLLRRGESLEVLAFGPHAPALPPRGTAPAAPAAAEVRVRAEGADRWVVEREGLERLLASPGAALQGVRAVPALEGGALSGFKLFAIRPGSLVHQLGLQNGDVLERVDGIGLTDLEVVLQALQRLRGAREVELDVRRRGQPHKLRYRLE
ncbi:MAG TPA: type II secretion system protein GspC [Myxococcota bacterium]|nr:type II secretion system protein GspC [Myxococcota bacterium]HRY91973.1 type II secretion system protein GspC [Myxococcota bacterium]HSA21381.1 type II secretion system protein GspC [Myxococcota bacterium]